MRSAHLPPVHLTLLGLVLLLAFLACAIDGTASKGRVSVAQNQWNESRGPVVPHDSFPRDCSLCHAGSSWHSIKPDFVFDHAKETGVALEGAHAAAECLRCHNDRGPVGAFSEQGCSGCHEDIHRGKLGKDCAGCHAETSWLPNESIARHARTRFPLVGAHVAVACFECHPGAQAGNFERTSIECVDCHRAQIEQATSPDHRQQGFVDRCDRCHIPTTWGGGGFNHFAFALTGAHATTACNACHANDVFFGTPSTCVACHQAAYDATSRPDHGDAGFSTDCARCHDTSSWDGASFPHTTWPLTGMHTLISCNACHVNHVYVGTPTGCSNCHQREYDGTNDPNHVLTGYPTTCQQCHNTSAWTRANFRHQGITSGCVQCHQLDFDATHDPNHAMSGYPTTCEQCHGTSTWKGASFDHRGVASGCIQCHQTEFNATRDPNHAMSGYPTTCEQCHGTSTWRGANFNHRGVTSGCVQCHQGDYNSTNDPNHAATGIPTTCQNCHGTSTWKGAIFNHRGITNGCLRCHQQDYNSAANPNHASLGYPTNCEFCHSTTTWSGSTFNHAPYFPIASGHHHNLTCSQCHEVPSNFVSFTCISCHEHSPRETNSHHNRVSGYAYNSNACYACHPNGQSR